MYKNLSDMKENKRKKEKIFARTFYEIEDYFIRILNTLKCIEGCKFEECVRVICEY